ncbi:unnamed protein product [Prorocentrum cordatum]|uniref:Uncharacterized protein n=1 Tax=Prorocentrum cordatum TaxID=2364126 RepID=A0ABN9U8X8_9DINO|nr:unnamed protein product [Polarella glacialis]
MNTFLRVLVQFGSLLHRQGAARARGRAALRAAPLGWSGRQSCLVRAVLPACARKRFFFWPSACARKHFFLAQRARGAASGAEPALRACQARKLTGLRRKPRPTVDADGRDARRSRVARAAFSLGQLLATFAGRAPAQRMSTWPAEALVSSSCAFYSARWL